MRRKLFTISIMQLAVSLACISFNYYVSAFIFGICVLYLISRLGFKNAILPVTIFFVATIFVWNGYFVAEKNEKSVSEIPTDKKIQMRGTVLSRDIVESSLESRENYAKIIIKDSNVGVNVLINLYSENFEEIKVGDFVEVYGKFEIPQTARNPRCFDYKEYLNSKEIFLVGSSERIRVLGQTQGLRYSVYRYTERVRDIIFSDVANRGSSVIGLVRGVVLGYKTGLDEEVYDNFRMFGTAHVLAVSGVKTLKLDIPLVPETRIKWALMPLHIAIIYILKLCLDEEIIPRCRFPCSRGYLIKCINWQKKQSFSVSQSYRKS